MTPDSKNIYCGSGEVWFNRFDSTGALTAYRHLGNVSKLDITPTPTTIEMQSSMNAARAVIAQATTALKMELDLTLTEFDRKNVALALLGDDSAYAQSSATITAGALGNAVLGAAMDTGKQKIVVTDVKHSSTTYVEGTDYTVDSDSGLITLLDTGTIVDGQALTWDGSVPLFDSFQVQGLSEGKIIGALRFRSSVDNFGPRMLVDVWNVQMNPSGAIALLGTAFAEIALKGEALLDTTRDVGQQFARVLYL
jgi:hypothetical protein